MWILANCSWILIFIQAIFCIYISFTCSLFFSPFLSVSFSFLFRFFFLPTKCLSICSSPQEIINRCLTNMNQYLTGIENQFYKLLVKLVKYWLGIGLWRLNIDLLIFLPKFNWYLTGTNQYILEANFIDKIG